MDVSIIVQTCDRYEKYWNGFFYYMEKFWDKKIKYPKYFCNEEKTILNENFTQIKTGKGSFVDNLINILNSIENEYVFYLLEDFWPIQTLSYDLFNKIENYIIDNQIKVFQVSNYLPYYTLEETNDKINNQKIFKFNKSSEWRFNFQSRFWHRKTLLENIRKSKIPEELISSSIGVEIESSKLLDEKIEVYFYHHFWYPISGVSYRGDFTNFGSELQNNMMVDLYGKNYQSSSSS
jgi:hypothetical protein